MPRFTLRRACGVALAMAALGAAATAQADQPDTAAAKMHGKTIRLTEASPTLQPTFVDAGAPGSRSATSPPSTTACCARTGRRPARSTRCARSSC